MDLESTGIVLSIHIAKTKAMISFPVTAKLICAFAFTYADCWFSHEMAQVLQLLPIAAIDFNCIGYSQSCQRSLDNQHDTSVVQYKFTCPISLIFDFSSCPCFHKLVGQSPQLLTCLCPVLVSLIRESTVKISCIMRKPVFGISDQVRNKLA